MKTLSAFLFGAAALAAHSVSAERKPPAPPVVVSKGLPLWQGLQTGMPPSEVASALQAMDGIKEVRILPERKGKPQRRLKIAVKAGGIAISEIHFEPDTEFGDGLRKISLVGQAICASESTEKFSEFRTALLAKYGEQIFGPSEITPLLFIQTLNRSQVSQESEKILAIFKNSATAVILTTSLARRSPPSPPSSYDNLAVALWKLADALYDAQKNKCKGTGDEMAEIALTYLSTEELEAVLKIENDRQTQRAEDAKSKL